MNNKTILSLVLVLVTSAEALSEQNAAMLSGYVRIQEDVNAVVCNNKDEQFTVVGMGEPVPLPAGRYRIDSWTLKRTDENGDIWKLTAADFSDKEAFTVVKDAETGLALGEPVISTLTASKEDSTFYIRHYLKGRLGEEVEITKNQSRPDPPTLLIRNEDDSYRETLTFQYG